MRCQETIIKTEDGIKGNKGISRNDIMRVQTPQAYLYKKVMQSHEEALKRGITNAVYTNTFMLDLGEMLFFPRDLPKILKLLLWKTWKSLRHCIDWKKKIG